MAPVNVSTCRQQTIQLISLVKKLYLQKRTDTWDTIKHSGALSQCMLQCSPALIAWVAQESELSSSS